jgi:hypothetical protein
VWCLWFVNLIIQSQTSHKTFIGNSIGFLIFKCSNFN